MTGRQNQNGQSLSCHDCREGLQDYLDGTLEKKRSLMFFLHLRDCPECQDEHDRLQGLYDMLQSLPDHPVPDGFDTAILASVPYEAYRAMEPLRRERVAVYLEEEFLPAWVRSAVTRFGGVGVAAAALGSMYLFDGPGYLAAVAIAAVLPQVVYSLQGLGRRLTLRQRRAEG